MARLRQGGLIGMSALLAATALLASPSTAQTVAAPAQTAEARPRSLSLDTPLLALLNDRQTLPILERYIPQFIALIEQQVIPAPRGDFTVADLRRVPEARVSEAALKSIDEALARLEATGAP